MFFFLILWLTKAIYKQKLRVKEISGFQSAAERQKFAHWGSCGSAQVPLLRPRHSQNGAAALLRFY